MFIACIILFVIILTYYNCYWKRRNYPPGPMPWPIIGNLFALKSSENNDPYNQLLKWRQQFGDVYTVWVGELPAINVVNYEAIQKTFVRDADAYTGRMTFTGMTTVFRGGNFGVVFTDGQLWREQRRFTLAVLRDFGVGKNLMQEKILDEIRFFFMALDQFKSDDAVFIGQNINICVGSIISSILFGFRYDQSRLNDFYMIQNSIAEQLEMLANPWANLLFWKLKFFKNLPVFCDIYKRVINVRNTLFGYIDYHINDHIKQIDSLKNLPENANDFIEAYLYEIRRNYEGNRFFSMDQLRNIVLDLLITGQDTTSLTLGWSVLYILHNSYVQEQIHKELNALGYTSEQLITTTDRNRLPYLCAVVNEAQRLTNLLPENIMHQTTRDVIINGYKIPSNTIITPQISCVLYDEKVFPNPYSFKPERFLDENGELKRCEEFIPFSVGKRACLGENLARMELFLILGNLYKRYKIKPVDELNLPTLKKIAGLTVHYHPFQCRLIRREAN